MKAVYPYKVLIVAPSLDIMGGQAVQADLLLRKLREDGVQVGFVPHNPRPPGILFHLTKIKYIRTLVVSFFYLIRLIRHIPRYDIIHIFSASYFSFILAPTPAILIARLFGKKILLNYHSGECRDHLEKQGKIAIPIIKLADRLVVPSGYLVDEFADFDLKAEAVYNVIDLSQFKFRSRKSFEPKIVVARNLEELYNIPVALKAYKIVKESYPDAVLTIVGSGRAEAGVKRLVRENGYTGITFTGRVEREEIAKLFDQHDIFLNSSEIDNMPLSFLEAYSSGLVVVSTDAGGIPYICEDGKTGLLAKRGDYKALAEKIISVIENDDLGGKLADNARKFCDRFSWKQVRRDWYKIYSDMHDA